MYLGMYRQYASRMEEQNKGEPRRQTKNEGKNDDEAGPTIKIC